MIYVHVPFCRSFCTYCDFYSEIACRGRDRQDFEAYALSLIEEIRSRRAQIEASAAVNTLYFGGGTPSVLPLDVFTNIVNALPVGPYDEFTVEVNPEDVLEKGYEYLRALRAMGVNRISMGVQSLDEDILRWMNRRHDASRARQAFRMLREAGFENISIDLIFGLSQLDVLSLESCLDGFLDLAPDHISAYQLSIEEGSALAKMVDDGRYEEASQEQCAEQYELICRRLSEAGYNHYEISNWARSGYEAKHNSAYWQRLPYVGLGPGAHSFDGSRRSWNSQGLRSWSSEHEDLSAEEEREELIMLGLRTAKGVSPSLCDPDILTELLAEGALIRTRDARVRIPESYFFISDSIIERLFR